MRKILMLFSGLLVLKSCAWNNDYSDKAVCAAIAQMTKQDQKYRFLLGVDSISASQKDSLLFLQQELDEKNTKKLIDIIAHRGWPNMNTMACEEGVPVLIFRHADQKYFDTIRSIIDEEFSKGRMSNGDYMFIDNHLMGRPMFQIKEVPAGKDP